MKVMGIPSDLGSLKDLRHIDNSIMVDFIAHVIKVIAYGYRQDFVFIDEIAGFLQIILKDHTGIKFENDTAGKIITDNARLRNLIF